MGQMGFYDLDKRLEAISAKGDPLELIKATVPWESFLAEIEAVTRAKREERKSAAGRKPYDAIQVQFRIRCFGEFLFGKVESLSKHGRPLKRRVHVVIARVYPLQVRVTPWRFRRRSRDGSRGLCPGDGPRM
jgi:hypothetical protein